MAANADEAARAEPSLPSGWAGEARARARLGTTLNGKWHLDAMLGVGGMAVVYAATHRNGKRAAIKMLHGELRERPALLTRFRREGYLANRVGHPGALSVLDDDVSEDGAVYMVMDLLDGTSLEDLRLSRGGVLPLDEALGIIDAILDVLVAAHAQGIVHRDLKPDNVFILRDGQVRVLDFGIAGLREEAQTPKVTLTGAFMGTPGYMAPEQARGLWDLVDAQTDLWAVGATLFTLLSGECLHKGRSLNEELLLAMTKPVPGACTLLPALPGALGRWMDRALAFEKVDRWPDARAMQREGRVARECASTPAPAAPTPPKRRWLPAALAGVAALAALVALAAFRRAPSHIDAAPAAAVHQERTEDAGAPPASTASSSLEPPPAGAEPAPPAPKAKPRVVTAKLPAASGPAIPSAPSVPFDPLGSRK
ncbi:serine/threonine protein kinase [Pendulispora rubella]|uniref:Serine/threonine protein kinase n=1 Tax=Pendulispora rubella TaxID=2741070 RepID=A0ABZ2KTJ8_9BACT